MQFSPINMKKKNLIIFGTRPEAIKMAPLVKEFQKQDDIFSTKVCITAQHREMLDQVLSFFEIVPDYDLDLMKPNQNLYSLTADIIIGLKDVLEDFKPDYVYVHGDTTTTMAQPNKNTAAASNRAARRYRLFAEAYLLVAEAAIRSFPCAARSISAAHRRRLKRQA